MKELNSFEVEEVNGGVFFLIPLTPAITTGIAVGATVLGATAVATYVGLRAVFNEM